MTAFFAIILSVFISFNLLFVESAKINYRAIELDIIANDALNSVMADYNALLRDEYGLFGLFNSEENAIRNKLDYYLSQNIGYDNRLYNTGISHVDIRYEKMCDVGELESQILNYCKLRVPLGLAEDIILKFKSIPKGNNISKSFIEENNIAEEKDRLYELKITLNSYIDNANKFGRFSSRDKYIQRNRDVFNKLCEIESAQNSIMRKYPAAAINRVEDKYIQDNKEAAQFNISLLQDKKGDLNRYKYFNKIAILIEDESAKEGDSRKENLENFSNVLNEQSGRKEIDDNVFNVLPSKSINSSDETEYSFNYIASLEDKLFSEEAISYAESFLDKIWNSLENVYEEFLINEYIISTFKSYVLMDNSVNEYTDFKDRKLSEKSTFLDYEIEYILHGRRKDKDNYTFIKNMILLIRFCINTIQIYLDKEKSEFADLIALAVTAPVGGAGQGIVSVLLKCGWGMGESAIDINTLKKGGKVPLFKKKGDFKLDIGISNGSNDKTDDILSLSYIDYLRLFLLTVPREVKLMRIADLIQLNMNIKRNGFDISNIVTGMDVTVTYSETHSINWNRILLREVFKDDKKYKFIKNARYQYV